MTTNDDTHSLTAFLTARLGDDEAAARRASPGPWQYGDVDSVAGGSLYDTTRMIGSVHYGQATDHDGTAVRHLLSPEADANGEHIARWDPSRVLADVETKRAILVDHEPMSPRADGLTLCAMCEWEPWPCRTVRHLAAVYADHPDYDEAWKP